uniref:Anaphase-promoting complex subunit 4 WD40 domain-containing protein n=1 Tax=Aureoumbra lagunensis TaxID=44058 RepID=A0A7S3JX73_9STRA|mmetsp:Transcript_17483/g.22783  ORF Transcript_17483/g.22783 Transcript_17483/m.22783 type:complete len:337 (+) Transcript_17483:85-1095(+)
MNITSILLFSLLFYPNEIFSLLEWRNVYIGKGRMPCCVIETKTKQSILVGTSSGDIIQVEDDLVKPLVSTRSAPIWSLQHLQNDDGFVFGDASGKLYVYREQRLISSSERLSGWVRAIAVDMNDNIYAVGCNIVTKFDRNLNALKEFDAGPSTAKEESWRRHDVTAISLCRNRLFCGLVDGSLREFDLDTGFMSYRMAKKKGSRIIAILRISNHRFLSVARDGGLMSFSTSSLQQHQFHSSVSDNTPLTAVTSVRNLCAFGTARGSLFFIEQDTLTSSFDDQEHDPFLSNTQKTAAISSLTAAQLDDGNLVFAATKSDGYLSVAIKQQEKEYSVIK